MALPDPRVDDEPCGIADNPGSTCEARVSKDPLQLLLEHLRAEAGAPIPTSSLGRLRRSAVAGARVGLAALAGTLRGRDLNLAALSPQALARLVEAFGELKGAAMKVGQILSYVDGSLAPEARRVLAVLQLHSQPTSFAQIERTIREDLGARAQALLARLEREPVAAASIGQVHRAAREGGTTVAVKVRHPGIEAAIRPTSKPPRSAKSWLGPSPRA
jgi:predicted unusual protein kinase regulating ubiquinone biosynthesis (AarF/ABC1/UbiB family)